jgi:two-component system, cell cycle response regulator
LSPTEPDGPRANTPPSSVRGKEFEALTHAELDRGKACLIVIRGRSLGRRVDLGADPILIGRGSDAGLVIDDAHISRHHARLTRVPEGFTIEDLGSKNGVFVNGVRVKRQVMRDGDRVQLASASLVKFCFLDEVEASYQKSLYDSATRDELTGVFNRVVLLDALEADFEHFSTTGAPLSLLFVDLDHFKRVNDEWGHSAGDAVLREAAALIQRTLRTEDVLARYGGEEFAVLLRFMEGARAQIVGERIRLAMERHEFRYEGATIRITCSIGIATLEGGSHNTLRQLIDATDNFLYRAKQMGRNRVVHIGLGDRQRHSTERTRYVRPDPDLAAPGGEGPPQAGGEGEGG